MNPDRPKIDWTPEKLSIMREHYPTMFNDALAKWIGCSKRTLTRKAREMGLEKVDNFNQVRAYDISKKLSAVMKRAYAEGRKTPSHQKGESFLPENEWVPGVRPYSGDIEAGRIEKIRKTYRRKKLLKIYGLNH